MADCMGYCVEYWENATHMRDTEQRIQNFALPFMLLSWFPSFREFLGQISISMATYQLWPATQGQREAYSHFDVGTSLICGSLMDGKRRCTQ